MVDVSIMTDARKDTAAIRKGEELDALALEKHLTENIDDVSGPLAIEQFPLGHSNLTYLIKLGEREMVLRRPPFGSKVKSAHDMNREFTILSHLYETYPPAPQPYLMCKDEAVIGCEFYVMERRRGLTLRGDKPADLVATPDEIRASNKAFIDNLVTMHSLDYQELGLEGMYKGQGYVERQVTGWSGRWEKSKTDDNQDMDRIIAWLNKDIPADTGATIIHNDYKYDNVLIAADDLTQITAVLDWEMATIGDPLADFAGALGYWTEQGELTFGSSGCFMTSSEGSLTRQEVVDYYAEKSGRDITNMNYLYAFALFKLAVILQQIYYRYATGKTTDERFAPLGMVVQHLAQKTCGVIDSGKY
jgi:aminoglycoside phosphotransferase (APT) family kinase protein